MLRLFGPKKTLLLSISVVVERDENRFHAYAPALKGLHVDGETEEDAFRNAGEAISVYLESLRRHGDPLPIGPDLTVHEEIIPAVPEGAMLRSITVQWPSLRMSGTS